MEKRVLTTGRGEHWYTIQHKGNMVIGIDKEEDTI